MIAPLLIAATLAPPTLTAVPRGDVPIQIDGRLDEAPWQTAPKGAGFKERTPTPGATPPAPSTVQVLYDRDAIYVGVRMALLPGEIPKAFELRRDSGRIWAFDAVTVKIDPRRDQRTTLGFAVNPAGARIDLIALDNGKVFRVEHDSVWQVATQVGPTAWTAEYRIPASALGVRATDGEQIMGLNVSRDHAARVATDDWALMPPGFGPVSALHYGALRGVQGLGGGRPFAVIPYGLVGIEDGDPRYGVGGEARVQIGGSGWAELSVRTDFAEVDLDDALINLDRFPLFFPERRPFFLNGLDVFEFGESGWTQLFFSRRIGLDSAGAQVPIHTGAKLFQRDGRLRGGLLSVVTGAHTGRSAALWNVARGRVEVGDGHVGAILTQRTDHPAIPIGGLGVQVTCVDERAIGARVEDDPEITRGHATRGRPVGLLGGAGEQGEGSDQAGGSHGRGFNRKPRGRIYHWRRQIAAQAAQTVARTRILGVGMPAAEARAPSVSQWTPLLGHVVLTRRLLRERASA